MTLDDSPDQVSADAQAIILICTSLGLNGREPNLRPFGPRAWATLSAAMAGRDLAPGSLPGRTAAALQADLGLDGADGVRLAGLLDRAGQIAFELERLRSRGIWVLTQADDEYPPRLWELQRDAPAVLFGAGDLDALDAGGLAVVGSGQADPAAIAWAEQLAAAAAGAGAAVISGGAPGIDTAVIRSAIAAGGTGLIVLPEGIERPLRAPAIRSAIEAGQALVISPYRPDAPFSDAAAIGRNRLIHALADAAVVVSAQAGTGGTWAGATENLAASWGVPLFVRDGAGVPPGNRDLLAAGARPVGDEEPGPATIALLLGTPD